MKTKKASLTTLIANDIIHLGMDLTSSFSYIIDLDDYIKEFDEESKNYIYGHQMEIIDEIECNEKIAQVDYNERTKEIDMVFYYDCLLDRVEKMICNASEVINKDLEIDDIREISESIYNDENFTDNIITKVAKYGGYENEI